MKHVEFGDILSVEEGIIVHGCNAQGVMGSGIAKQIREKWPHVYETYHLVCGKEYVQPLLGAVIPVDIDEKLIVANAITQESFGRDNKKYVSYKAIYECFDSIARMAIKDKMHVHYPLIGAGLGGGDWSIISEIIETVFSDSVYRHVERTLWIYE